LRTGAACETIEGMRKQLFLGVVAALGLCSSSALAARTNFVAHLKDDGSETGASGEATFTYDDTTRTLCGRLEYMKLAGVPQEFELQASGTAADVTLAKAPAPLTSPLVFSKVLTVDDATNTIMKETPYVNLLTSTFPDRGEGEINGILEAPADGKGTDACPVVDAGTDAGKTTPPATSSSSSSSSSSPDDTSSSSTVDAGKSSSSDGGGCSTVGDSNAASGLGLATIAGMGLALILRGRRRRK